MRFVEITIPAGKHDAILGVLDDEGIDYVMTDEVSGRAYTAVVSFPLPTEAVEPILDDLREAGLDEDAFTIVLDAQTVVSRRYRELEQRYAEEEEAPDRISREEIRSQARDLAPSLVTYVVMIVVSVVVATAGVLLDSAAVVVGSMVIAPLIGPAMATSVGTVLQDRDMFVRGSKLQLVGFGVAIVSAAAFAWLVKSIHLVALDPSELLALDQVRERLAPDFLSLAVALGAGIAGAYSLSAGVSSALVGVMIAVALVPPTAVIGIGIAWGLPMLVLGATVLVLVNFASINLAALVVLWYQGYRPEHWFREDEARTATFTRVAVLAAVIVVLSTFLGAATYSSFQAASLEDDVRGDVRDVLRDDYPTLSLLDLRFETETRTSAAWTPFSRRPGRVTVTVGYPSGTPPPGVAAAIDARVDARVGRDVDVQVRFLAIDRAE